MNAGTDNERLHRWWLAATALLLASLLLPAIAAAADPVGRVLSVRGDVTAVRDGEPRRTLSRGDDIFEGDEITTGPNGRTQVRFIDEGLTNLSPATTFAVDEYRLEEDDEDGGGSIVMSFLRGAMRTVTGLIGDREQDTYRMNTPTATIGVRGTGYALQYCDAACASEFGGQEGLYGRVDEGSIQVDTPGGSAEFGSGQYFFVAVGGVPAPILQPPSGILDGEEDEGNGDGGGNGDVEIIPLEEDEEDDTFLSDGGTDETDFEAGDELNFAIDTIAVGVAASWDGSSGTALYGAGDENFYSTDDSGVVTSAVVNQTLVRVQDAQLFELDMIEDLGVGWGRWEGDFLVGESSVSGNMAFTVADSLTDVSTLGDITGGFTYDLAGGPSAFETDGTLWSVDALSMDLSFLSQSISADLNTFQLSEINGAGTLSFDTGSGTFDGDILFFSFSNNSHSGGLQGQLIGTNAEGMIVVFDISESEIPFLSGTSILEQGDSFILAR